MGAESRGQMEPTVPRVHGVGSCPPTSRVSRGPCDLSAAISGAFLPFSIV